ncbi:MAG: hypothetical protein HZA08_08970 [Nitrospirae bacterium]|nr:hypothetical protein [Nitrospirota bacterium]
MNDLQQLIQQAGLEAYRRYLTDATIGKKILCPFHGDKDNPNFSIHQDTDGVFRFKCFA